MRELMGNATAVPPQFFNGDVYCGVRVNRVFVFAHFATQNFDQLAEANELGTVKQFLKL